MDAKELIEQYRLACWDRQRIANLLRFVEADLARLRRGAVEAQWNCENLRREIEHLTRGRFPQRKT